MDEEDVVGLEIAMNDPLAIGGGKSQQGGLHHGTGSTEIHRPGPFHQAAKALSFEVLHDQKRIATGGKPNIVDLDDVLVPNGSGNPGFLVEALNHLVLSCKLKVQKFHGHPLLQADVFSEVHRPHATFA